VGHPVELIQRIRALLESEYDPSAWTYVIERFIPGTRMSPDIQVVDGSGKIQCAVEIGYTRPEKLAAYRNKLHITDVRWYDKQGNLHADVQERVIVASVELRPAHAMAVYKLEDEIPCPDCLEEALHGYKESMGEEELHRRWAEGKEDVWTWVVTDYTRACYPSFCDQCGGNWFANPEGTGESCEVASLHADLEHCTPTEIGHSYCARELHSWDSAVKMTKDMFGLDLNYREMHPLGKNAEEIDLSAVVRVEQEAHRIGTDKER